MQYDENAEKYGYEGEMTPLKCDKLNAYKGDVTIPVYGTIADAEVYLKEKADEAIEELKTALNESEEARYEAGADAADYYQENRRLKRALWLARALRAEARKNYWYARSIHEGDERLWSIDGSEVKYIGCIKRNNFDWLKIWCEVEIKCRAKAEEYK